MALVYLQKSFLVPYTVKKIYINKKKNTKKLRKLKRLKQPAAGHFLSFLNLGSKTEFVKQNVNWIFFFTVYAVTSLSLLSSVV